MLGAFAADYLTRPTHRGKFEGFTHYGVAGTPGDGPSTQLFLMVQSDGRISRAGFETVGCPSSIASAGVLCLLITGRNLADVQALTAQELIHVLGGLPDGKGFFADLAIQSLSAVQPVPSPATPPAVRA